MWTRLLNNMNTINLVSFSVPLLATTIFDKLMVEKTSEELEEDCIPVQRWLKLGSLFMFIIITIFYGIGAGSVSYFHFGHSQLGLCLYCIGFYLILKILIIQ